MNTLLDRRRIVQWDVTRVLERSRRSPDINSAKLSFSLPKLRLAMLGPGRRFSLGKIPLEYITPIGVWFGVDRLSNVLTAISHPSRRAIIGRLAKDGPTRFTDVAEPFEVALNAITKHLKLLERAGLIEREKQGREVLISLRPEPLRLVKEWVHVYEQYWNEKLNKFEDHFKEKRKAKL